MCADHNAATTILRLVKQLMAKLPFLAYFIFVPYKFRVGKLIFNKFDGL